MTRKILQLLILFSLALIGSIQLQSCNDEGNPITYVHVIAERSTGKLFTVDATSGAKTEIGTVTFHSNPLTNIRGMVYSNAQKKLYASSNDQGGGKIYTIDPKTLQATLFDGDAADEWYGVADLLMTADNKLLGSLWYTDNHTLGEGAGIRIWNSNATPSSEKLFVPQSVCCGFGIVFNGTSTTEFLLTSFELEIYKSDLNGNINLHTTLTPAGFESSSAAEDLYIQNLAKDLEGEIYGLVYDELHASTYFASVDVEAGTLTNIAKLNTTGSNRYHALVYIAKNLIMN